MRFSGLPALLVALAACGSSGSPDGSSGGSPDASSPPPPPAGGPVLPVGPLSHQGRWLTDATGRVLLFHGVNVVNKLSPFYPSAAGFSDDDAAWLATNGFRVVRLGVLGTGLSKSPGVVDAEYIDAIASTVSLLAKHDIFALLDMHQDGWGPSVGSDGFPDWMTLTDGAVNNHTGFPLYYIQDPAVQASFQSFWNDEHGPGGKGLQEDYVAMLSALAQRFAGDPEVLGYDLFNEPWPGTTWKPCIASGGCGSLDKSELDPVYAKAVKAIRAAGDHHLIFGEPFVTFNYGVAPTEIAVPGADPNAGMSFHVYPLASIQGPDVINFAVAWSKETGGALLNTEWGATTTASSITLQTGELDSALVPWIFWSYCCEVVTSLTAPPSGTNLVSSTVDALVEPHPLAVAGTPQKQSYDPETQTLSFSWSTVRPGGGAFESGAVSSFEIPARVYPKGYQAIVSHGSVASPACAALMTVVADADATDLSVTVSPGGSCPK
jgi:endoglycosylceramidase